MAKMTIQEELLKAAKVAPKKGEPRQKFLERLREVISEVPEKVWEGLSGPAQAWYIKATADSDADNEIEDFEDADETTETSANDGEKETDVSTKKNGNGKPAAKPKTEAKAEKPAPKAKPVKEAKDEPAPKKKAAAPKPKAEKKGPGKLAKMRLIVVKNINADRETINAKIAAAGIEAPDSSVTSVIADTKATVRVLQANGFLAKPLIDEE